MYVRFCAQVIRFPHTTTFNTFLYVWFLRMLLRTTKTVSRVDLNLVCLTAVSPMDHNIVVKECTKSHTISLISNTQLLVISVNNRQKLFSERCSNMKEKRSKWCHPQLNVSFYKNVSCHSFCPDLHVYIRNFTRTLARTAFKLFVRLIELKLSILYTIIALIDQLN